MVLGDLLVDDELGHGVGDPVVSFHRASETVRFHWVIMYLLLEQDGAETRVEGANSPRSCRSC